ncbi:lycopene cyclase domain-containing protein [Maribellus sp. YY47]|uniref:lycopene cyclase domain-containing protein n=1 Tax=Maribellus sp. YY47 TaxID=2929486 RepID=UPI0020016BB1|nr:lycopene cyclase domain-containing protein [Maribellus sp. YY47]MCK3684137.1 lycopene cyclase domain-containing protein [Maribellus sp. YY47]
MSLYFWLLFGSIAVPLLLSFDKRLHFYTQWKYVLPSIFTVAVLYISIDIYFTRQGFWGFNDRYISGLQLFHLPVEEILFFIVVPYASIFLHEAILEYFPQVKVGKKLNVVLIGFFLVMSLLVLVFNLPQSYTAYISGKLLLILILALVLKSESIRSFFLTFLVILLPFLLVNGVLTGSFITDEVVWYNNTENLGIRIFTIPVEDFAYAFTMILLNLLLIEKLKQLY